MVSKAQRAASDKYNARCGRIELRPLKEDADKIKAAVDDLNKTVQQARACKGTSCRHAPRGCSATPRNNQQPRRIIRRGFFMP